MTGKEVIVLIPAYRPDDKLVRFVHALREVGLVRILVVDDGSGPGFRPVFDAVRPFVGDVLVHAANRGKGAALRTGFAWVDAHAPSAVAVVTADADGQHRPEDVLAVARAVLQHPGALTVGVRAFVGGDRVPLRSRFGNAWSRYAFFFLTGVLVRDTQTGLRGVPRDLLPRMLSLRGDRYEYEMRMLADARNYDEPPVEVPIATVYINDNATSHFHPVRDAIRTQWALVMFCISSVLSFLIDNGLFALMLMFMGGKGASRGLKVFVAIAVCRFVSANFNYLYNRFVVFHHSRGRHSFFKYWGLVLAVAALSCAGTALVSWAFDANDGLWVTLVKIVVDTVLFVGSYTVQKRWIFRGRRKRRQ